MTACVSRGPEVTRFLRERIAARTGVPLDEVVETSVLVDLGLQSLDAVLVCGEVEDAFNIELDPSAIFEHDTLGDFSSEVTALVDGL